MKETFDNAPFTVPLFVHLTAKCRVSPSTHIPLEIPQSARVLTERLS